jgi:hypothetical protein
MDLEGKREMSNKGLRCKHLRGRRWPILQTTAAAKPQILTKFCEVQPFGLGLRGLVERSPPRCDPTNLTRTLTCYFLIPPSAFFLYSYRLRTNWAGSAVDSRTVSSGLMMILRDFPSGPRRILSSNVAAAVSPWHRIDWPTVVKAG